MSLKRKSYLQERDPSKIVSYQLEQLKQQEPYKSQQNLIEELKQLEASRTVESRLQKLRQQEAYKRQKKLIEELKHLQGVLGERSKEQEEKYKELSDVYAESFGSYPPASIAERHQNMSSDELFKKMKKTQESHNDYDKAIRRRNRRSSTPQGNARTSPTRSNMPAYELSNIIREELPDINIEYESDYENIIRPNPVYKGGTGKRKKRKKRKKTRKLKIIRRKYTKRGKPKKKKSTRKQ